jgi:hypothetical protein
VRQEWFDWDESIRDEGEAMPREEIIERFGILGEFPDINVEETEELRTIRITHRYVYSLNFEFKWADDHFIGYAYAEDSKEEDAGETHAVISIWNPLEATSFVAAYTMLSELRANRPNPNE